MTSTLSDTASADVVARTLQVGTDLPNAYPTVGAALAAATDGTVVSVAPGEYPEAIYVNGVAAVIVAAAGPGTVVIDATALPYPAVGCVDGTVELRDLTVRAGDAPVVAVDHGRLKLTRCELSARFGAGVRATNSSHVELVGVRVPDGHHGFVIDDSTGLIADCEVTGVAGDGIIVRHGADPEIRGCTVRSCGERGCYVYQFGRPTLTDCRFADVGEAGIAVAHESAPTIRRCRVERSRGPGIAFGRGCGGSVADCTFSELGGEPIAVAAGAHPDLGGVAPAVAGPVDTTEQLLAELAGMIGLAGVKAEVRGLIDEIQVNEWRRGCGLSTGQVGHHLVFAGAPGTGKTTVARLYGRLLSGLHVLPTDTLVEVGRQDLVAGYLGQTAAKTEEVFRSALGGVLFIDEAYALARSFGAGRDFGQEAIDTLVKLMEDHRGEIAVIVAGYTREMAEFLAMNPGLASRFARTVEFASYTPAELVAISGWIAQDADYQLEPAVEAGLLRHYESVDRDGSFGNGRDARRLFDRMRQAQAGRLRRLGRKPTRTDLRTLTIEDLRAAVGRHR